jgi:hypothetical protein
MGGKTLTEQFGSSDNVSALSSGGDHSSLSLRTDYPGGSLIWFSFVSLEKFWIMPLITPQPLPSASFAIYYTP